MKKQNSKLDCFEALDVKRNFKAELDWLKQLSDEVDTVVEFGCWSCEPFALLWTLKASRVEIIEKDERNLITPKYILENLLFSHPYCIKNDQIFFYEPQDMIKSKLPSNSFDLAYCKRVLSNMKSHDEIQCAIKNMARIIKPGGFLIAVESMPDNKGRPKPKGILSSILSKSGLNEIELDNAPGEAYCFKKPMKNT